MDNTTWATEELNSLHGNPDYELERLLLDINEKIVDRMDMLAWRNVDLAQHLDVSRAFVTKLLNGNTNMKLSTLVGVANALGVQVSMDLLPNDARSYETEEVDLPQGEEGPSSERVIEIVQIPLAA